eukprot:EC718646.1.p3 GENE.EC718646.1~~EC718646.1.p3  ORF type:complete len:65 (-),score=6.58 EC718646.1:105-299(-)
MLIVDAVRNVVEHHHDNVGIRDAIFVQNLISMADVRLMAVILPLAASSNQNSPIRSVVWQRIEV